jgi:hypothetical protein
LASGGNPNRVSPHRTLSVLRRNSGNAITDHSSLFMHFIA